MGGPGGPAGQDPRGPARQKLPRLPRGPGEGRSQSSCKVLDGAGRAVRESGLGGRTPSQAPPLWGRSSGPRCGPQLQPEPGHPRVGPACVPGWGVGANRSFSQSHRLPTLAVVHPQAHPGRGMSGPPRAHTPPTPPPPLWAWEGCGVGEPGSLQKGPAATLRRRPGPRQCPAWASGSTCWPKGRCGPQASPGEEPAPWGSGLRWSMGSPSCTEGWGDRCAQGQTPGLSR